MDIKSRRDIVNYYHKALKIYGGTHKALIYKSAEQQNKTFALLTEIEPIFYTSSILDIGCGLGDLCKFLRSYGWKGKYTGIDIAPTMIAVAKKKLPDENFLCLDILTEQFDKLYDYVFCASTLEHKPKYGNEFRYLEQMIKKCFSLAKKGVAFDIFSDYVDYRYEKHLYVNPSKIINFCYSLTRRVVLRNDARPYTIMVYLYKDVSKDDINFYSNWIPFAPQIIKDKKAAPYPSGKLTIKMRKRRIFNKAL